MSIAFLSLYESAWKRHQRGVISEAGPEEFDSFGRSWAWSAISVQMLEPQSTTLIGVPLAWSSGTDGPVTVDVVYAPLWEDSNDQLTWTYPGPSPFMPNELVGRTGPLALSTKIFAP